MNRTDLIRHFGAFDDPFSPLFARRQIGIPVRGLVDGADHVAVVAVVGQAGVEQTGASSLPTTFNKKTVQSNKRCGHLTGEIWLKMSIWNFKKVAT